MTKDELDNLLRSPQSNDRVRALERIVRSEDSSWTPQLMAALHDRIHHVAALAAEGLEKVADYSEAAQLLERFDFCQEDGPKRDPGSYIRSHLAFAFGRLSYNAAIESLRGGIRTYEFKGVIDQSAALRANSALALAELRAPDALRDISDLLFSKRGNPGARAGAAQAIGRLGLRVGLIPLDIMLSHFQEEAPEVLAACMESVVHLEDESALELLTPYLHHHDEPLAVHAAITIAKTRSPEAVGLLMDACGRFTGDSLHAAILTLATLRTDESNAALRELAVSPREGARLAAVEGLGIMRTDEDKPLLLRLSEHDPSPKVRAAAQSALQP
jgi:HEAT repeat protein